MKKRVLVAEDEPNIIESLTFLLEQAGYEVSAEMNGRTALDRVLEAPPAVMVLDVMLPGLDGLTILRSLRDDPRGADLPVLMLSAKGQDYDRDNALQRGADIFMTKPFSNAEVVAAVKRLAEDGRTAG